MLQVAADRTQKVEHIARSPYVLGRGCLYVFEKHGSTLSLTHIRDRMPAVLYIT
jgi:hypothetical protein